MRGVLIFTILSTEKRTLSIKTSTDALFFQKKKKNFNRWRTTLLLLLLLPTKILQITRVEAGWLEGGE